MEKDLVDIVMEKSYIELTQKEKLELNEFCSSESEFDQMKQVFLGVEMMKFTNPAPKKETKESLDSLFDSTFPKAAPIWYMAILAKVAPKEKPVYRQPLLQIAAVGLLLFFVYPLANNPIEEASCTPQMAVVEDVKENKTEESNSAFKTTIDKEPTKVVLVNDVDKESPGELKSVELLASVDEPVVRDMNTPHSDGVYDPSIEVAFSQPASSEPEMLDLLTASF